MRPWLRSRLGDVSRWVNQKIPGALPEETLCGRCARKWGPLSPMCLLIDSVPFLGFGHCYEEMLYALRGLRKK